MPSLIKASKERPGRRKQAVPTKTAQQQPAQASLRTSCPEPTLLSPRDWEILCDVIRTHTASGEPVSSRAVSKHAEHRLSAASIRNIMADLEELGFLLQPHISAGRVPTPAAYRLYVESLMQTLYLSAEDKRLIDERLQSAVGDGDTLMSAASRVLSDLSCQVGVVLTPKVNETILKSMHFVSLEGRRILCVVVSTGSFVDNVVVEADEVIPPRDLERISNYLNENFAGVCLGEIRERLLSLMSEERAHVDQWLAKAIELGRKAMEGPAPDVFLEGTTTLLTKPELADTQNVRRVIDTFADKARLVGLLNSCLGTDGVRLYIGEDSDLTSELSFSLVATPYGVDERLLGSLGVLGPSRMEYPRVVALVRYLGESLSNALAAGS